MGRSEANKINQNGCNIPWNGMQVAGSTKMILNVNFIQMVPKGLTNTNYVMTMTRGISRVLWSSARTLRVRQTFRFQFYLPG